MGDAQKTINRLLSALEILTLEEEHLFETGFYIESTAVQKRAMPLATKIAGLLVGPGVVQSLAPALQVRIQKLLQGRRAHYEQVSAKLEVTGEELQKLTAAATRARQLRPAYGATPSSGSVVSLAG